MSKQQQRQAVFFSGVSGRWASILDKSKRAEIEEFFYLEKKGKRIISAELNLDALYAIFLDDDGELLPEFTTDKDELDPDLLDFMMDDLLQAVQEQIPEDIWENLEI